MRNTFPSPEMLNSGKKADDQQHTYDNGCFWILISMENAKSGAVY